MPHGKNHGRIDALEAIHLKIGLSRAMEINSKQVADVSSSLSTGGISMISLQALFMSFSPSASLQSLPDQASQMTPEEKTEVEKKHPKNE